MILVFKEIRMKKKTIIISITALCLCIAMFFIISKILFLGKNVEKELEGKVIKYSIESTMTLNEKSDEFEMKSRVYAITEENKVYVYDIISNGEQIIAKKMKAIKNISVDNVKKLIQYLENAEEQTIIPDGYLVSYDDKFKYIDKDTGDKIIKDCKLK